MGEAAVKKVVVEVEVPENVREEDVRRYLENAVKKLIALAEMEESPEPTLSEEAWQLLNQIKRNVAERSK